MKALEEYRLNGNTGCSLENPKVELDPYYSPWIRVLKKAPKYLDNLNLRNKIEKMPLLSTSAMTLHEELRLAHIILGLLTSGYVWQDETKPSQSIPACLAVPFVNVSEKLGLKPVVCNASLGLANWKLFPEFDHSRKIGYDDFDLIYRLRDCSDWDAFFKITYLIEFEFASSLTDVLLAIDSSVKKKHSDLESALNFLAQKILKITSMMSEFHDRVNPDVFYDRIRPFLEGWPKNSSKHPNGMLYEGTGLPNQYFVGASNAQSLIVHIMDSLLGMIYINTSTKEFLDEMLNYMILEHRQFIQDIRRESCVREFIKSCESTTLKKAYNNCIEAVSEFRSYHIQIATKYIIIPSWKRNPQKCSKGTGGTDLMPFLKSLRDETNLMKL